MADKKRAKKKTTARKRSAPRKRAKATPARKPLVRIVLAILVLGIGASIAAYYFGSFKLRTQMERVAIRSINLVRSPEWMPRPFVSLLNMGYDAIPGSLGLVVEGGELGHEDSPLIAGVPHSKSPVRVLHNQSYINLFNEKERQAACIAFKIRDEDRANADIPDDFFEDPRIKQLRAKDMRLGQWMPHAIAPPQALATEFGEVGANEACLVTNLAPMSEAFSAGLWQRLIREIAVSYPKRFGEIWIYLGPVMREQSSKLDSGVPIPDGFYAIAFDLTETGGLRAIAFLVPQNAPDSTLRNYITSISKIEKHTGLQFLPDVDYHAREVLGEAESPQLW
jgi:endonuclease G